MPKTLHLLSALVVALSLGTATTLPAVAANRVTMSLPAVFGTLGPAGAGPASQAELYTQVQRKLAGAQADVFRLSLNAQIAMDKCVAGYESAPMPAVPRDFTRYRWLCD